MTEELKAPTEEELLDSIKKVVKKMEKNFPDEDPEKHIAVLSDVFLKGLPAYQAMGYSRKFIEALYATAYQSFKGGDYNGALPLFKLLSKLDAADPRYLSAVASCYFAQKDYNQAQMYFIATSMIALKDPFPLFYAAECFIEMKDLVGALFFLRGTVKRANALPNCAALAQRAQMTIDYIQQTIPMRKLTEEEQQERARLYEGL